MNSGREVQPAGRDGSKRPDPRQALRAYRPPRLLKRRSVARATLFTGGGVDTSGVMGSG